MELKVYQPTSECVTCRGTCCKQCPGAVFPQDCGPDIESGLREMMRSGRYTFDYWEGAFNEGLDKKGETSYFVRPRVPTDEPDRIINGAWGGRCTFLTDTGCELPFEKRPTNCKMLKPRARRGDTCDIDGHIRPKEEAIKAWRKHGDIVAKIIKEFDECFKDDVARDPGDI